MKALSRTELSTLHNTRFFEVKASATQKIESLFAEVRDEIKKDIKKNKIRFPKEVDSVNGKIFRGENYLGLPYLVLDYPKHFSKDSVLAFRTMFWWGNFFSFTLHLQGKALKGLTPTLSKGEGGIRQLKNKNIFICVSENPWQYHYKKDNYIPLDELSDAEFKKHLLENKFVKLSRKIPIKNYKKVIGFCKESFSIFNSLLAP